MNPRPVDGPSFHISLRAPSISGETSPATCVPGTPGNRQQGRRITDAQIGHGRRDMACRDGRASLRSNQGAGIALFVC